MKAIREEFTPQTYGSAPNAWETTWEAPSNIALVKYWGKHPGQIPANASLSFTLNKSVTRTRVAFKRKDDGEEKGPSFDFLFHGEEKEKFHPKLYTFLERAEPYLPFLGNFHLSISTENTFPHSSGIASSASGMAALASCLVDFEQQLQPANTPKEKASFIARLGSGSACRSIDGPIMHWGEHPALPGSADLYGSAYTGPVHPVFKTYKDTILIVEEGVKGVSSTEGHRLMEGHPFAEQRFKQAGDNMVQLLTILEEGNLDKFAEVVEREALSLHAMMMSSTPSYILMKPNTLEIINRIRQFRKESGANLCFTLDAGANVHALFPEAEEDRILHFIKNELIGYCQNRAYICDEVGSGATKIR